MSAEKEELPTSDRSGTFGAPADSRFLLVFTLIALLVRYFFIPHDYVINGDGAYYTILGERFVSGDIAGGISAYWSPLYSVLTGFSSLFFTERDFAGRFVSLVAGSLLVIPAFLLTREFFGRNAAYLGSILLIFHPLLIKSSGWVMTESVYGLVLTTLVLVGWHALSKGRSQVFLTTGLLLGVAFLIKPEAIGYLVLVLLLTVGASFVVKNVSFSHTALNALILLLGFSFFFLPYFLYLHHKTGEWTLSQKIAINLPAADHEGDLLSLTSNGRMTMKDRFWGDDYDTEYIPETPDIQPAPASFNVEGLRSAVYILGAKAIAQLKKQLREYFPIILPIPFGIFAMAGFFVGAWNRTRVAKETYLFSFVMCTLLGYAASSVELRYLFPIIPLLIAWTARGVAEFCGWLTGGVKWVFAPRREISPIVLSACVLVILLALSTPNFFLVLRPDDITNVPFEEKAAGLWIKEHSNQTQPIVVSSHITPAFYANAKHLYLPKEELSTIVEYAKLRRADYLVFSQRRNLDGAAFLAEKNSPLRDLKLVFSEQENADYQILIYQLDH